MARNVCDVGQQRAVFPRNHVDQIATYIVTRLGHAVEFPLLGTKFEHWNQCFLDVVGKGEFSLQANRMAPFPIKEEKEKNAGRQTEHEAGDGGETHAALNVWSRKIEIQAKQQMPDEHRAKNVQKDARQKPTRSAQSEHYIDDADCPGAAITILSIIVRTAARDSPL